VPPDRWSLLPSLSFLPPLHRLIAILNPQSDRGRTARLAESLRDALAGRFDLQLKQTTQRNEAATLAREAGTSGCDAVMAIGGDGTVHEVVNGLMALPVEKRPALGILPAGSGNDVAYALGIGKDLQITAKLIAESATRWVDVGRVDAGADRRCYCINNIGLLLEGEINRASHDLTWPRGSGLYLRAMVQTLLRPLPAAKIEMIVDGQELRRTAMLLSIGNGPRSGGKFQLMPDATLDDGYFDYLLAPPVSRWKLIWKVRHVLAGRKVEGDWIQRGRFKQMTLQSDQPLVAHVDGEPWLASADNARNLSIIVLLRSLRVLCPAQSVP
jgi:diacylglycerol kinase (ATP)